MFDIVLFIPIDIGIDIDIDLKIQVTNFMDYH